MECLETAAKYMEKAERYEVMGDIYRIVIPIYEKLRNFQVMWVPLSQRVCVCVCMCVCVLSRACCLQRSYLHFQRVDAIMQEEYRDCMKTVPT